MCSILPENHEFAARQRVELLHEGPKLLVLLLVDPPLRDHDDDGVDPGGCAHVLDDLVVVSEGFLAVGVWYARGVDHLGGDVSLAMEEGTREGYPGVGRPTFRVVRLSLKQVGSL